LKEMVREGLVPAEISAITVAVPPPYLRMVNHGVSSGDRSSYLTSAPYQLALGVLAPEAQFSVMPAEGDVPESVRTLMAKVKVQADESLLEHYPRTWPARVAVSAGSGDREKLMLHVPGDPQRPLGESEISDKFSRVVSPLLGEARAAHLAGRALAALGPRADAARLLAEIETACRGQ
jgi:2-methylcitrate dehydratase PrpD